MLLIKSFRVAVSVVIAACGLHSLAGAAEGDKPPTYASDAGRFDGDHLTIRTNITGFKEVAAEANAPGKCAPAGSKLAISSELRDDVLLRFYYIHDSSKAEKDALDACPKGSRVNTYTQYKIAKSTLQQYDFKRSGVAFGGLIVPFKFRLGNAKELVSSSTVAPYVGFRTAYLSTWGLSFTPIVSAGVAMVPVVDSKSNTTSTKSAFSAAIGLVLTSSKNDSFNAGLVLGRDFLSRADRDADPTVSKGWLSFYVGYAL